MFYLSKNVCFGRFVVKKCKTLQINNIKNLGFWWEIKKVFKNYKQTHNKLFCPFSSKKSPRKWQKVNKKSSKFEDFSQQGKPCILRGKSTNDIGVGTHFCVILDLYYGEKSDTFRYKNVFFFMQNYILFFEWNVFLHWYL